MLRQINRFSKFVSHRFVSIAENSNILIFAGVGIWLPKRSIKFSLNVKLIDDIAIDVGSWFQWNIFLIELPIYLWEIAVMKRYFAPKHAAR